MAEDKIKRAFVWLRQTLRITERTTLPGAVLGEIRPTIDTFGWDRRSPQPSGVGNGPINENAQGGLAADTVLLSIVPAGIMRYVLYLSYSHDDPAANLALSVQIRTGGPATIDIGLDPQVTDAAPNPVRQGFNRPLLLEPGTRLLLRSSPAPAAGQRLFIRYRFVDLDFGEYIQAL